MTITDISNLSVVAKLNDSFRRHPGSDWMIWPPAAVIAPRLSLSFMARMLTSRISMGSTHHAPLRPVHRSGMSEAQRIDLQAARDGKITWAQYFAIWGPGG